MSTIITILVIIGLFYLIKTGKIIGLMKVIVKLLD
jgi:hypothetical protein